MVFPQIWKSVYFSGLHRFGRICVAQLSLIVRGGGSARGNIFTQIFSGTVSRTFRTPAQRWRRPTGTQKWPWAGSFFPGGGGGGGGRVAKHEFCLGGWGGEYKAAVGYELGCAFLIKGFTVVDVRLHLCDCRHHAYRDASG